MSKVIEGITSYNKWFYSKKKRKKAWQKAHKIDKSWLKKYTEKGSCPIPDCLKDIM